MPLIHLVAHAARGQKPFRAREACVSTWRRLQARFSRVLACALLPDHVHLILDAPDPLQARRWFVIDLAATAQSHFPGRRIWDPVPEADTIPNSKHLLRQIRYVHLNPCRDLLVPDPVAWEWSTHRDALGAAAPAWMDVTRVKRLLGTENSRFAEELHRYISGDPSVRVEGTPLPYLTRDLTTIMASANCLKTAILQAGRLSNSALGHGGIGRYLAAHLASRIACERRSKIAGLLGIAERTVRALLARPPTPRQESILQAASYLLSDPGRFNIVQPKTGKTPHPHIVGP